MHRFFNEADAYRFEQTIELEKWNEIAASMGIPSNGWAIVFSVFNPYGAPARPCVLFYDGMAVATGWRYQESPEVYLSSNPRMEGAAWAGFFYRCMLDVMRDARLPSELHSSWEKHDGAYYYRWHPEYHMDAFKYSYDFFRHGFYVYVYDDIKGWVRKKGSCGNLLKEL